MCILGDSEGEIGLILGWQTVDVGLQCRIDADVALMRL